MNRLAILGLSLLVPLAGSPAPADVSCRDYRPYEFRLDRTLLPYSPEEIAYADSHLFGAAGADGFFVYTEGDPGFWVEVAHPAVTGFVHAVDVSGARAWVAADDLLVFDVSDPSSPVILATIPIGARCVRSFGDFAAVGREESDLVSVIDLQNPSAPIVTDLPLPALPGGSAPGVSRDVEIENGVAAFGFDEGLVFVSVSDPSAPTYLGGLAVSQPVFDIAGQGGLWYAASALAGLRIVDATDPTAPFELASVSGSYRAVLLLGNRVLVGDMRLLDVSDPANPVVEQTFGWNNARGYVSLGGERIVGTFGRTASPDPGEFLTFEIPDETPIPLDGPLPFGQMLYRAVDGNRLVGFSDGNLECWDVTDPFDPSLLGLTAADYGYGFYVQHGSIDLEGDFAVSGATNTNTGTQVSVVEGWDLSDPSEPQRVPVRYVGTDMGAPRVRLHEGFAYAAPGASSLRRFTVPNLGTAGVVFPAADVISDFDCANGYAFSSGGGLEVFDLSGSMSRIALFPVPAGYTNSLALDGTTAFVTGGTWVYAIDVSDPHTPSLLGSIDLNPWVWRTPTQLRRPIRIGDYLYVATPTNVEVVDVSDVTAPVRVAEIPWRPEFPQGLMNYAGVLLDAPGTFLPPQCLLAVSAPLPEAGPFLAAYPNPFRDRVTIDWARLGNVGAASRLDVYDVQGRRVRSIARSAQQTPVTGWDGRDERGRPVAAGVYWLRAQRGEETSSRPVVRLR
ncbi:MAG: hypothetical protein R3B81_14790 [bacterium]